QRVADIVASEIGSKEYVWFLLGLGPRARLLSGAYGVGSRHHQLIADAIEARLEMVDPAHREMELYDLAAIDQGPRMRSALLRAVTESSFPHWAARALLEHFASDPEVTAALEDALTAEVVATARLGSFAGRVLGPERGRSRL